MSEAKQPELEEGEIRETMWSIVDGRLVASIPDFVHKHTYTNQEVSRLIDSMQSRVCTMHGHLLVALQLVSQLVSELGYR